MKKLLLLSTLFCLLFAFTEKASASHVAAGQIDIIHNDTGWVPCAFPDKYIVNARFYRECTGIQAPNTLVLTVKSTCFGSVSYTMEQYSIIVNGDTIGGGRALSSNCITGNDLPCTEEYIYRYYNTDGTFNVPIPGPCKDWTFSYSENARPGNNENVNGGTFYVETKMDNSRPCDTVVTGPNGIPPNDSCFNTMSYNNSAVFNDDRPVVTFCVGKSYKYFIGATDPDGDSLAYRMINPLSDAGTPVGFTAGYSLSDPLPVVNRPVHFDAVNGILEFIPAQAFVGAFAYVAEEWRDSCYVDSISVNGSMVAMIKTKKVKVGETTRDTRLIFGIDCITNLPVFGNDPNDPNAPVDPNMPPIFTDDIVINCATREFNIRMNVTLQCNTLEPYGTDFRIVSGTPKNPTGIFAIDSAWTTNCKLNEFTNFTIRLFKPIGPGVYKIFIKTGDDFNTLQTKCGIDVPEYTTINLTVEDNFKFELDFDSLFTCRPANPAPVVKANFDDATFYSWYYKGIPIGGDSAQTQEVDSNGLWTVKVNVEGCEDTDDFYVDITRNRPVVVPSYYLCPEEIDTLKIRMDTVQLGSNHTFSWFNDKTGTFEIVSTQPILDASSFNRGGVFISEIVLNNICTTQDTFEIRANPVIVDIGRDSTICAGDEYWLYNKKLPLYKVPEEHTYQWYINGVADFGSTNDSLYISRQGWYRLDVTKRGICSSSDSVYITVADTLAKPEAVCSIITYKDGQIQQLFYWEAVPGAESYEVQEIKFNGERTGWIPSNGLWGQHHLAFGAQTTLIVRAVNDEVDDGARCKYSKIDGAEACDVIVKSTNVFTPNGDGVNDFLTFDLLEVYPGSMLKVFNRWGKLIYEDANYQNDWDGGDAKEGTYFYILDINDPSQGKPKGTFTILRGK